MAATVKNSRMRGKEMKTNSELAEHIKNNWKDCSCDICQTVRDVTGNESPVAESLALRVRRNAYQEAAARVCTFCQRFGTPIDRQKDGNQGAGNRFVHEFQPSLDSPMCGADCDAEQIWMVMP